MIIAFLVTKWSGNRLKFWPNQKITSLTSSLSYCRQWAEFHRYYENGTREYIFTTVLGAKFLPAPFIGTTYGK